ncbi:MAG: hypothetical protein QG656_2485, partial [Candidatus Hydrogenedentes bacterium]|nr:hypothetical protein [Candidatus Hydrogenedentota bacterium]
MDHVAHALRENRAWRPMSFYLLIAIPLAMLAALPVFYTKEDPKRFALHLILIFVFLFIVVMRAVFDMIEIGR